MERGSTTMTCSRFCNPTSLILPDDGGIQFLESSSLSYVCFGCHCLKSLTNKRIAKDTTTISTTKDDSKRCSHCGIAIYCSRQCYNMNHIHHETICQELVQLQQEVLVLEELLFLPNNNHHDINENYDNLDQIVVVANHGNTICNVFYKHLQQYYKTKYLQEKIQNENQKTVTTTTLTWKYYTQRWKLAVLYLKLAKQSHSKYIQQIAICHALQFSQCEGIRTNIPMFLIDLDCDDYAMNFTQYCCWMYDSGLNHSNIIPHQENNNEEVESLNMMAEQQHPDDTDTHAHVEIINSALKLSSITEEAASDIVQSSPYFVGCGGGSERKLLSRFDDVTPILDQMSSGPSHQHYNDDGISRHGIHHRRMVLHFAYALLVIKVRVVVEMKSQTKGLLCLFATCPMVAEYLHPVESVIAEYVAGSPEDLQYQQHQIQTILDFMDTWNPTLLPSILYPTPLLEQTKPSPLPLTHYNDNERTGYPSEAYVITKNYKNMLLRIRGVEAMLVARYGSKTPSYNYQMTNEDYGQEGRSTVRQVIWYRRRHDEDNTNMNSIMYCKMILRWFQVFGWKDLMMVFINVFVEMGISVCSFCWCKKSSKMKLE